MNLGKTISIYHVRYRELDPSEILLHTLVQNGIENVANLEYYIRHDILQFGSKLSDLRYKLVTAYQDIDLLPESEDIQLEQHADQVISGSLFEDFGIDLLGLKDMEGINVSSIPSEIWNRKSNKPPTRARVRRRAIAEVQNESAVDDGVETKLSPIPTWNAIVPERQIGLLREFYQKRAAVAEDMVEVLLLSHFRTT